MTWAERRLYSRERHRRVIVEKDGQRFHSSVGSLAWFNPHSPHDRKLYMSDPVPDLLECDYLPLLQKPFTQTFVVYQCWCEPDENGFRYYSACRVEDMQALGRTLRNTPVRDLLILGSGFLEGAIQALGDALAPYSLDYLGLGWAFSGDDITDKPSYPAEIAQTVRKLGVRRLCLLTATIDERVEGALLRQLYDQGSRLEVSVFDPEGNYPLLPTPRLERLRPAVPTAAPAPAE